MVSSFLFSSVFLLMVRIVNEPIIITKVAITMKVHMKDNILRKVSMVIFSVTKIVYIIATRKKRMKNIVFLCACSAFREQYAPIGIWR